MKEINRQIKEILNRLESMGIFVNSSRYCNDKVIEVSVDSHTDIWSFDDNGELLDIGMKIK